MKTPKLVLTCHGNPVDKRTRQGRMYVRNPEGIETLIGDVYDGHLVASEHFAAYAQDAGDLYRMAQFVEELQDAKTKRAAGR